MTSDHGAVAVEAAIVESKLVVIEKLESNILDTARSVASRFAVEYIKRELAEGRPEPTPEQITSAVNAELDAVIDRGKMGYIDAQLGGEVRLTRIDGYPVVRVTLDGDPHSYVIANSSFVMPGTDHFDKYIARQHIDAGESAGLKGRPVTLIWRHGPLSIEAEKVVDHVGILEVAARDSARAGQEIQPIPQPKRGWSLQAIREWKDATFKPATGNDLAIGVACGLMQVGMTACLTAAKIGLSDQYTMGADFIDQALPPAALSMLFGTVIGTWNSTYRALMYRGSPTWRNLKNTLLVSFPFAYSLVLWQDGVSPRALTLVENVGFDQAGKIVLTMGTVGLWVHLRVVVNSLLNNLAKVGFQDLNKLREKERLATGTQASLESQVVTTIGPYTLKMSDLTDIAVQLGEYKLKVGTMAMVASIPAVHYATLRYAEKNELEEAARIRESWEERRAHPIWKFLYAPTEWAARAAEAAGFEPANLVTGMASFSSKVGNALMQVGTAMTAVANSATSQWARLTGKVRTVQEAVCERMFLPAISEDEDDK